MQSVSRTFHFGLVMLLASACSVPVTQAQSIEFNLDRAHTHIGFRVRHMMVSWVRGAFQDFQGKVLYDPNQIENSKVEVIIQANSIDTGNERRDNHLRSADFLDVEKYPEIRFVSKRIVREAGDGLKVIGDLTLHGVTKEVVLDVEELTGPITDPRGLRRMGVSARTRINRKDFGLTWNRALETGGVVVGDDVFIEIEAELVEARGAGTGARQTSRQ